MGSVQGTTSDLDNGLNSPSGAALERFAVGGLKVPFSLLDRIGPERLKVRRRAPGQLGAAEATALLEELGAHDDYTAAHSQTVVDLALQVAAVLRVPSNQLLDIEHAALLHDIGKIEISDALLAKPGPLSAAERFEMRRHTEIGECLVGSVPNLEHLAPSIRAGHERWDGFGYPDGLRGEEIPLASRIIFVCDAYDAMTSDRSYRRALPREVAIRELVDNAGTQFCPTSVWALLRVTALPLRRPPASPNHGGHYSPSLRVGRRPTGATGSSMTAEFAAARGTR